MKKITLFALCLALNSCGVANIKPIGLQSRYYDLPILNEVTKREIGDQIAIKGEEDYQEAYIIEKAPKMSVVLIPYPFRGGEVVPLAGETKDYFLYYPKETFSSGSVYYTAGVAKRKTDGKVLPFINSVNGFGAKENTDFEAKETTYINPDCKDCFKKEIVFNGKSGNELKFSYREYINNMARPAFSQDLQYDLSESNVIGFKGLRIEVMKATNTSIEYKVLKSFE